MTTFLSGFNMVKPFRRAVEEKRRSLKKDDGQYRLESKRNSIYIENKKHNREGYNCKRDFLYSVKSGDGGEFSDFLPKNYTDYSDEVKYGYYMDPVLTKHIACWGAADLKEEDGTIEGWEAFCHQALDEFRAVLREEKFDLTPAIMGAKLILRFSRESKGEVPKELYDLAKNLLTAGDRIGCRGDFSFLDKPSIRSVTHSQRCETGDVLVVNDELKGTSFRTKPVNTNKTIFRFLRNKIRGSGATRDKVGAAYQSLYHAVSYEKEKSGQTPYVLEVSPLYGSTKDGSSASKKDEVDGALKETIRFLVRHRDARVQFAGETNSHAPFRNNLRTRLNELFKDRDTNRTDTKSKPQRDKDLALEGRSSESSSDSTTDSGNRPFGENTLVWATVEDAASDVPTAQATNIEFVPKTKKRVERTLPSVERVKHAKKGVAVPVEKNVLPGNVEDQSFEFARLRRSQVSHHDSRNEAELPKLQSSDESSSYSRGVVKPSPRLRLVQEDVAENRSYRKGSAKKEPRTQVHKSKKKNLTTRLAARVRNIFNGKSVADKAKKKVAFQDDGDFPQSDFDKVEVTVIGEFESNGRRMKRKEPLRKVERKEPVNDLQVSSVGNAEQELSDLLVQFQGKVKPSLDRWINISEEDEIDAYQLLEGLAQFSVSLEELMSKTSALQSNSSDIGGQIRDLIIWVQHSRSVVDEVTAKLSSSSVQSDQSKLRKLLGSFIELMGTVV